MSYIRGLGTSAIEYGLTSGWTPPPPPPKKLVLVRATPAMARASRGMGELTTDQAIDVVKSEGGAPASSGMSLRTLALYGIGALAIYSILTGGGGAR